MRPIRLLPLGSRRTIYSALSAAVESQHVPIVPVQLQRVPSDKALRCVDRSHRPVLWSAGARPAVLYRQRQCRHVDQKRVLDPSKRYQNGRCRMLLRVGKRHWLAPNIAARLVKASAEESSCSYIEGYNTVRAFSLTIFLWPYLRTLVYVHQSP